MQVKATVWRLFEDALDFAADRPAVVEGDTRRDHAATACRVRRRMAFLAGHGVAAGDRVALLAPNGADFFETTFAVAGLGAVLVPLNTRWSQAEIGFALADSGARVLVHARSFADSVERLSGRGVLPLALEAAHTGDEEGIATCANDPDALAFLYYTSGTTGRAKGVMLTNANVCVHAAWTIEALGLTGEDRWAHVAPMFHLADAWATLAVTQVGGLHVMAPRFDPGAVGALIETEGVTLTNLVPTMLNRMVADPGVAARSFPSLRRILSGGAPIALSLVERVVEVFGCEYVQTYGMTETSPFLTMSLLDERQSRLGAQEQLRYRARTGRPFAGIELEVVDEKGTPVPRDDRTVGEIRVRGASVTPGYWRRSDETSSAFQEGWLCTGDLAVIDREGFVNIVDRKKDVILSGGETIYSTEVENVLASHPDVHEVAVYGAPDEDWGEVVRASVVLVPGAVASEEELIAYCKRRMAPFKAPRQVVFSAGLPRTGSGKIAKGLLRDRARDGHREPG